LAPRDLGFDAGRLGRDDVALGALAVVPERRVERDVARPERLLDVAYVLLGRAEPLREQLRAGLESLQLELLLLLAEVVEELPPRVRRPHADEARVVEQVLQDVRADPPA